MNKIYVFRERDGTVPFIFFFQSLDEKLQAAPDGTFGMD